MHEIPTYANLFNFGKVVGGNGVELHHSQGRERHDLLYKYLQQ
jgi:hypothetical protein